MKKTAGTDFAGKWLVWRRLLAIPCIRPCSVVLSRMAGCTLMLFFGALWCANAAAQTATYSHGSSATAAGSGSGGTPSLSFNVQAGQNRVVFINAAFEREHCSNSRDLGQESSCTLQTNWASPSMLSTNGGYAQIAFRVTGSNGSLTLRNPLGTSEGDLWFAYVRRFPADLGFSATVFSAETYAIVLYEHQLRQLLGGTGAGTLTITLPTSGFNASLRAGDEALLSALQFNHVHQLSDGGPYNGVVRSATSFNSCGGTSLGVYFGGEASSNWVCPSGGGATAYDSGQAPATGDGLLQFGWNGYSRSGGTHGFSTRSGSTDVLTPAVINTGIGNWLGGTEADGFSTAYRWTTSGVASGAPAMTARAPANTTGGMWLAYTIRHAGVALSITKTDGITAMLPGASTTYTVVVTNNDYEDVAGYADGAVVRDPAAAGLTKTAVSCTASGGAVCPSGLTVASLESGATIPTFPPGSRLTFSVTATADAGATGSVTNTATITPPSGYTDDYPDDNTDSDTNSLLIPLTLQKTWANATVNDAARLTLTGSPAPSGGAALNAVANTANETDTGTTPYGVVAGRTYTLTELFTTGVAADYTKSLACTGNTGTGAALTYTPDATSGTIRVGNTATAIVCTFTNARQTQLTLIKTVTNDGGGTQPATAWTLSATGPTPISGATGTAAVTNAPVSPGTYSLSESALPAGYSATPYVCSINGGAPISGNSITLAAGDAAVCTIHNDDNNEADVSITKTAKPEQVVSGGLVEFSLLISNVGPAAADQAVVRDPAVAGLDCLEAGLPAPTCSATGGASCPVPLTAAGLQAGIAIPVLPDGGIVYIGLACRVTATGVP
ncbi:MAG: DUF11 domain-containing protein [Xanthomonadaceae bacterium]|nr:DUF11 domain-containing protein [Xanthomonadaceae bacterium]